MSERTDNIQQEKDVSDLLQVRRDKLAALQERGKDPFRITKFDQTHHSSDIRENFDALEGQTVNIDFENGIVYVDNVALQEPYINDLTHDRENFEGPFTVPDGCVFVMGDNRNQSTDSRASSLGAVDTRCIMGRVYATVFPIKNIEWNARNPY